MPYRKTALGNLCHHSLVVLLSGVSACSNSSINLMAVLNSCCQRIFVGETRQNQTNGSLAVNGRSFEIYAVKKVLP